MKTSKAETDDLVDVITALRSRNNVLWMKLLRIALKKAPHSAKKVLREIVRNDRKISKWMSRA